MQGRNSYTDGDGRKYGIAIHNTSNDASDEQEASYATRRTDGTSSHLYVDADSVIQSLDTGARAGHAGSRTGNENAYSVEITGGNGKTRDWWLENVAWAELGRVLAWLIRNDPDLAGFEVRRASVAEMKANPRVKAFYGHNDMRLAWGGTTHTDPGPNFPWDRLLGAVRQALGENVENEEDDMLTDLQDARLNSGTERARSAVSLEEVVWVDPRDGATKREPNKLAAALLRLEAGLATLAGRDFVDEQQIVDGVLTGLGSKTLEEAAAALTAAFGAERAAELGALLVGNPD